MGMSILWMPMGERGKSSDWIVAMDTGGRVSCSTREDMGFIGEMGWMEGLIMGRVSVIEEGEEIDMVDIVGVIKGIEDMGMKSG